MPYSVKTLDILNAVGYGQTNSGYDPNGAFLLRSCIRARTLMSLLSGYLWPGFRIEAKTRDTHRAGSSGAIINYLIGE